MSIGGAEVLALDDSVAFARQAIEAAGSIYDFAARHPEAESMRGRQTIFIIPGPRQDRWVVRRLSHGGLLAPVTGDRFLRLGTPRPFNELELSRALAELGVPTPQVVAAVVYRSGPTYRGEVAREEITNAMDLAACLFGDSAFDESKRCEALAAAGLAIGSAHRVGLIHSDLNLRNVLVQWSDRSPLAYILDIEKSSIAPGLMRLKRGQMMRRFQRSALKFESQTGKRVNEVEWDAFVSAYKEASS
jgi:3-deoxy-D-manno-octulosonic acid kinase